jgi:nicotinamide mononucleotide adenylyltransferase
MSILETNDTENVADAVVMIEQLYKHYDALLTNNPVKARLVQEATKDMKWRKGLAAVADATAKKWLEGLDNNN